MSPEQHAPLIAAGCVWVAVKERRIVGFVSAEMVGDVMHIWEMSVARSEQGHGLGRALLNAAIEAACARHARSVTLTTFRDVVWNAPFYAASGFRILAPQEIDPRLRRVLDAEAALGLPGERRCAMQLAL
jgi:GNAT superfamily N-acetyltransferase